jgi:hypothetical protein
MTLHNKRSREIAALNDLARKTFRGCNVMLTQGIMAFSEEEQIELLQQVRAYNCFTPQTDPYGEHDFGSLEFRGRKVFWKFSYYDRASMYHTPDAADAEQTTRVLTVMLAEEY